MTLFYRIPLGLDTHCISPINGILQILKRALAPLKVDLHASRHPDPSVKGKTDGLLIRSPPPCELYLRSLKYGSYNCHGGRLRHDIGICWKDG